MRYRKLDANGDYTFGHSAADFLQNLPETVAQAVQTRLDLYKGEWFLDITDGTPWNTEVLGKNTQATYDAAIKSRILGTPGVKQIDSYTSTFNPGTRALTVNVTLTTIYGQTTFTGTL